MPFLRVLRSACIAAAVLGAVAGARAQGPLPPDRPLTQVALDAWGRADGLPQLSVTALAQTPDGFLWAGTQEGLARFDGLRFASFDAVTGHLPRSAVSALHVDAEGALWVGTRGGVARRRGRTFEPVPGVTDDAYVFALSRGPDGAVWAGTRGGGVARFDGRAFVPAPGLDSLGGPVTALAADGAALWVGTLGQGLSRWEGGRAAPVAPEALGGAHVTALLVGPEGLTVGTLERGLFRVRGGRARPLPGPAGVRTLHRDPAGTLWAGTEQGGLVRLAGADAAPGALVERLPHPTVRALLSDREGSLWIGTEGGGLARIRPGKMVTWGTPEGLGSDIAFSVVEGEGGAVWVGTEGGGISRITPEGVSTLGPADGLPGDVVLALAPARGGGVWAGFHGAGLALVQGGRVTRIGPERLPAASVFGLHTDPDGTAWAATSAGLVRVRGTAVDVFTEADGLTSDVVTAIARDAAGRLLVGTYEGGLTVLDTPAAGGVRAVATVREADGLGSEAVISVLGAPDGTVWLGTEGGGLSRVARDGSVATVRARDGLPSDIVLHALRDGTGALWLSTNRGLVVVQEVDVAAFAAGRISRVPTVVYDEAAGLRTREFNGGVSPAGWKARDGTLWFAGAAGAVAVPPGPVRTNAAAPPVAILGVRADGVAVAPEGPVRLGPGLRRLSIDYTALSFIGAGALPFRYRLDGVDDGWVEAGTIREADYTNLSPGRYTFRVQAANADGVWSEAPATLDIELAPSLTQTWWFRALAVLAGLGLLGMAYAARVGQLTRRQRELERVVAERTATIETEKANAEDARNRAETAWARGMMAQETIEAQAAELATANGRLEDANGRLAETNGRLAETNAQLADANAQLAETSEVKSHLMRVVAHDLNNPLGVVIGYADVLDDELPPESEGRELVGIIQSAADEMKTLVKRFLGAEAIDAGRLAMDLVAVDLGAIATDVGARFEPLARQKGQSLSVEAAPGAWVLADRDWFKEVADNLVSNAVKYTPLGRGVRIRVDRTAEHVRFCVEDDGPGLTAEDQSKLFGRFQRLSAQPTGEESSTGLGLSIVKKVVEMHGGRVWAESEPGRGATFIVELDALSPEGDGGGGFTSLAALAST